MVVFLGWKTQTSSLNDTCHVQVEKVTIENRLYDAGHHSNPFMKSFGVVTINPVEKVQGAIWAESEQVMGRDRFRFTGFGHHKQLGQDGHSFKINRVCPQNLNHKIKIKVKKKGSEIIHWIFDRFLGFTHLHEREIIVDNQSQKSCRSEKKFNAERVVIAIVGGLEFEINKIKCGIGCTDEEDLKDVEKNEID